MSNEAKEKTPFGEWFFESDDEKEMGVETCLYENGGKSKRCKLSDGRVAVSHRLKGKDSIQVNRVTNGETNKVQMAVAAICTKIDGKDLVMEDMEALWFNDFTKIVNMAASINFL